MKPLIFLVTISALCACFQPRKKVKAYIGGIARTYTAAGPIKKDAAGYYFFDAETGQIVEADSVLILEK